MMAACACGHAWEPALGELRSRHRIVVGDATNASDLDLALGGGVPTSASPIRRTASARRTHPMTTPTMRLPHSSRDSFRSCWSVRASL